MKANWFGKLWIIGGLLLLAAALCLALYNIREQTQAANSSVDALQQIQQMIQAERPRPEAPTAPTEELEIPDYLRDPNMPMPEKVINGYKYIGVVSIPSQELTLPVMGQWSYPHLKIAPCRYEGSAYLDDMIIMAHNYVTHFGKLAKLQTGDGVYFEDMAGNIFQYQVVEMETLDSMDGEALFAGEWDLTLFTCTVGGKSRVTVRCERVSG